MFVSHFTIPFHPHNLHSQFSLFDETPIIYSSPLLLFVPAGQNNQSGKSILKTDYTEENTLEKNKKLAVKILLKTMDATTPSAVSYPSNFIGSTHEQYMQCMYTISQ